MTPNQNLPEQPDNMKRSELLRKMAECIESIGKSLVECVLCVRELIELGEDMRPHCKQFGILTQIVAVAKGRLSEKALIEFYKRDGLLKKLACLPIVEQDRLIEERVPVIVKSSSGENDHRLLELKDLCPEELDMVIDTDIGGVRTPEEQVRWLECKVTAMKVKSKKGEISVDPDSGLLSCKLMPPKKVLEFIRTKGLA